MKEFVFVCGGAESAALHDGAVISAMNVEGKDRNVNLRLSDVSRSMLAHLPDLLVDLLEIAAYVYCADQRASRGNDRFAMAGEEWRRDFRFIIPVRHPHFWNSPTILAPLQQVLDYLSEDRYLFEFIQNKQPVVPGQYFIDLSDGRFTPDEVALFSGGVDSLAGVIDSIVGKDRNTVLVGHHSAPKVVNIQKRLVESLQRAGLAHKLFHVTVNVTNTGVAPAETTQRSRSFLFSSLAFVIARMFGLDRFTFYENGVVSLNLPIAADVLGARATRTTHPRVIRGFERIFSEIAQREITIATPFLWLTKKEVIERLIDLGYGRLLETSVSCVHPHVWTKAVRHCGSCSQCIDRRFAVLAAGAGHLDPASGYGVDLLVGDRTADGDRRLPVAYLKFVRSISSIPRYELSSTYPAVAAAFGAVPGLRADDVLDRIWDLHRRHAEGVLSVMEAGTQEYMAELVRQQLPDGCLLSLQYARDRLQAEASDITAQVEGFLDQLTPRGCEFAVDKQNKRIVFKGGFSLDSWKYKLIAALLPNHREGKRQGREVAFFWTPDLADALELKEPTLRRQIVNLREEVEPRLTVDHGLVLTEGFIENLKSKGYRLAPELKEVSLTDLETSISHTT